MKYILIQNDGEIETNSFELIGASTKRNDSGKIGFFGSGLKYSIAYMMRNGIYFRIFSGSQELLFTTKPETLKEQTFDRICINGKPTSYTVTMGPTWKEDWFVLREIYCNAVDEGSCQLIKETDTINAVEGKTRIYIQRTENLEKVIENWDAYFSDERTELFESPVVYTSYLGNSDIKGKSEQKVKVFNKTDGVLYRRGIRVYSDKNQLFDYECEYVTINEDRTASDTNGRYYLMNSIAACLCNEEYVCAVLRSVQQQDKEATEYTALSYSVHHKFSEAWIEFSKKYLLVLKEKSGKYMEQIGASRQEVLLLPSLFAFELKKKFPEVRILGLGSIGKNFSFDFVEKTSKMEFLLKEVLHSLDEMDYHVSFPIEVAEFDDENVLGYADLKEIKIYISTQTFDRGRREIAMTLIEENEHLKSKFEDESREFQTHLITKWLSYMEDKNGLFL